MKRLELSALQNRGLQSSGQPVRNNNGFNLPKDQGLGGEHLEGMTIPRTRQVSDTTKRPREKAGAGDKEGVGKERFGGKKIFKKTRKQTSALGISQSWGAHWLLAGQEPLAAVTSLDSSASQTCQRVSWPLLNVMSLFENQGWV